MGDLRSELLEIRRQRGEVFPALAYETVAADRAAWPGLDSLIGVDWDDEVAGPKWRIEKIRKAMQSQMGVTYSKDSHQKSLDGYRGRSWFAIKREGGRPTWEPVEAVVSNPVMRKIVFAEMQREIEELVERYKHLEEFAPAMARALKRLEKPTG